jgi:hypothetical protein
MELSMKYVVMLLLVVLAAPVAAHHAAEGIISEDLYDQIEESLEGTPHLDMDLSVVGTDTDMMVVTTVTVPTEDVDEVVEIIADEMTGEGSMMESSIDITLDIDGDMATVTIFEDIGAGESQY